MKLFKNLVLFIVTLFIAAVVLPFALTYNVIRIIIITIKTLSLSYFGFNLSNFLYDICKSIDQLGNVVAGPLFNDILIKKGTYKFGHEDEKISSVLGKAKERNRLTFLGRLLSNCLDWIDNNHVIKSIDNTIEYFLK